MKNTTTLAALAAVFVVSAASADEPMQRGVIAQDGVQREYFVYRPPAADGPLPVVVAIHGYTSTATGLARSSGLNRHAAEHGYMVVYPQGSHFLAGEGAKQSRITSWNDLAANQPETEAGPHCLDKHVRYPRPPECSEFNRCAWTSCYDDVGFIGQVLDEVAATNDTDRSRYYLLGVSNGGMMTLRLGCNMSERFAAIAPIIAQLAPGYDCGPAQDLPMLHLYGGADNTVRGDGKPAGDGYIYTSAAKTAATWALAMACASGPLPWENEVSNAAGFECSAYSDCRVPGQEVISCKDGQAGHEWPQQGIAGVSATCITPEQYATLPGQPRCGEASGEYRHLGMDLIWDFFSRYSLSAATPAESTE